MDTTAKTLVLLVARIANTPLVVFVVVVGLDNNSVIMLLLVVMFIVVVDLPEKGDSFDEIANMPLVDVNVIILLVGDLLLANIAKPM